MSPEHISYAKTSVKQNLTNGSHFAYCINETD